MLYTEVQMLLQGRDPTKSVVPGGVDTWLHCFHLWHAGAPPTVHQRFNGLVQSVHAASPKMLVDILSLTVAPCLAISCRGWSARDAPGCFAQLNRSTAEERMHA